MFSPNLLFVLYHKQKLQKDIIKAATAKRCRGARWHRQKIGNSKGKACALPFA
jgi:hypothetical protein